jgi:uncharacterized membrane protein YfcA
VTLTAAAIAFAIGAGMGILGGGGSLVAIPAFTFVLHLPAKEAVVTSLVVVGIAAAAGAIGAFMRKTIPLRVAMIVGASAAAGAFAGGLVGARLDDGVQLAILGGVMCGAAILLWRQTETVAPPARHARWMTLMSIGVVVGALTGIVGVGGGFLMVPALIIAGGLPMREAAAASLFVIAIAAFSGLVSYAGEVAVGWPAVLPMAAVAAIGTLIGGALAWRLPQRRLQQAFAIALVCLGTFMLIRS